MSESRRTVPVGGEIDPETMAALLDGRLSSAEREALLRRMEADPDAIAMLADAAAAAAAEDAADGARVVPLRRRGPLATPARRWLLAAAIAALALVPVL